ncbi:MAG: glycosyltransferase [Blastocatellia bacterium]|nr:glycosyltransferase [Blastocatellia bacterium]
MGDGPLRAELEAQALSLGISDRVHFLGEIRNRDIAAYYHASDVSHLRRSRAARHSASSSSRRWRAAFP